ncbi:MAG: hypothetical protein ACXAEN_27045 [Candidatus Thorarchaeota archaeon]
MSDKWEAIVIKLFLGVGGYLMLGSSRSHCNQAVSRSGRIPDVRKQHRLD